MNNDCKIKTNIVRQESKYVYIRKNKCFDLTFYYNVTFDKKKLFYMIQIERYCSV